MNTLDPWGPLDWVLQHAPVFSSHAFCLGSVAPEDRCTAAPQLFSAVSASRVGVVRIVDPPSSFTERINQKTEINWALIDRPNVRRYELPLFASDQGLFETLTQLLTDADHPETVVLDVTCLPKRLFFFYLKLLLRDDSVRNVLVTYTLPGVAGYPASHLSGNPDELRALPGFAPTFEPTTLVISVGFESLGLPHFLSEYRDRNRRIVLLVPFPPGQPHAQRTWQTLQKLGVRDLGGDTRRIAALDMFDTVRQLRAIEESETARAAEGSTVSVALAPYGPKPMSVGMALYAIEAGAPVFYTQPKEYHPDYSSGRGDTWAYVIKYGGGRIEV